MSPPSFSIQFAVQADALRRRLGFNSDAWLRTALTHLAVLAVFGFILPWQKGVGFLDPVILGSYACFGVVFAGPAAAHDFQDSDPAHGGALTRILVCVLYGEFMAVAMITAAIATVYSTRHVYVGPDLASLAICAGFGLSLSLAVSTLAVWISLAHSQSAARGIVRIVFLVLLIGFFLQPRRLPAVAPAGIGIALGVAALAVIGLRSALMERVS